MRQNTTSTTVWETWTTEIRCAGDMDHQWPMSPTYRFKNAMHHYTKTWKDGEEWFIYERHRYPNFVSVTDLVDKRNNISVKRFRRYCKKNMQNGRKIKNRSLSSRPYLCHTGTELNIKASLCTPNLGWYASDWSFGCDVIRGGPCLPPVQVSRLSPTYCWRPFVMMNRASNTLTARCE